MTNPNNEEIFPIVNEQGEVIGHETRNYCHSGARSSQACRYLKQKGYQAENIGGIVSYRGAFG